jgi:hypothetical protein
MSFGIFSSMFAGFTTNGMLRNFKISCLLGDEDAKIIGSMKLRFVTISSKSAGNQTKLVLSATF